MKRITISLSDEVASLLLREARRRAASVSEVARQALASYFGTGGTQPRVLPFARLGESGYRHTAREMEKVFAEEWGDDRGR